MAEDSNPSKTVPDPLELGGPKGLENGATPPAAMSLEDINKIMGRSYATIDDARQGLEETKKFVGQKEIVKEVIKEVPPANMVTREEFDRVNFFRENPEANKHQELVTQIAKANGISVQEAFKSEFVQNTMKQLKTAEDVASTRSTLTSNPRLGIISDASTKAKEAFESSQKARASGDVLTADRLQREAESSALSAVIKAFDLDGKKISD